MWQPAQSRCLNFANRAREIKAFSHSLSLELPVAPRVAPYLGTGSPDTAASFECRLPS